MGASAMLSGTDAPGGGRGGRGTGAASGRPAHAGAARHPAYGLPARALSEADRPGAQQVEQTGAVPGQLAGDAV